MRSALLYPLLLNVLAGWPCDAAKKKSLHPDSIIFEDEFREIIKEQQKDIKDKEDENSNSSDIFINGQYVSDKRYSNWKKNKYKETQPDSKGGGGEESWISQRPSGGGKGKIRRNETGQNAPGAKIALVEEAYFETVYHYTDRPVETGHLPGPPLYTGGWAIAPLPPAFPYPPPERFKRQSRRGGNTRRVDEGKLNFPGAISRGRPVALRPDRQCMTTCPTTPEYNPVCGDDAVTYTNPGKLSCTLRCGKKVQLLYYGNCIGTTSAPTRDWNKG